MEKLDRLVDYLLAERGERGRVVIPASQEEKFRLYRSLVNVRPAVSADEDYLRTETEYLTALTAQKGITDIADLSPIEDGICLWKGDITTLRCDAIVNATNAGMTGCWHPCHSCIHTFAGIRLRYRCSQIMEAQGHEEPTGRAKNTIYWSFLMCLETMGMRYTESCSVRIARLRDETKTADAS